MANNPNNKKNLKPFKPGKDERRNLEGRPPKLPDLDKLMAEVLGEEKDGKTAAQVILAALRAKASRGDIRAAEVLLNRGYGVPKQKIEHSSDPELPVIFKLDGKFKDATGEDS
jgi:hypothetical protein